MQRERRHATPCQGGTRPRATICTWHIHLHAIAARLACSTPLPPTPSLKACVACKGIGARDMLAMWPYPRCRHALIAPADWSCSCVVSGAQQALRRRSGAGAGLHPQLQACPACRQFASNALRRHDLPRAPVRMPCECWALALAPLSALGMLEEGACERPSQNK